MNLLLPAIVAGILLAACSTLPPAGGKPALVLEDAERFAALLAGASMPTKAVLQTGYLDGASEGVTIFTPQRIESAENLARAVARDPRAYRRAVDLCLPVARGMQEEASALIARVGTLLGERHAAAAYVVFGAGNSGGTADARGLVLGLEVLCAQAGDTEAVAQVLRDFIAHEMTHVHQARAGARESETDLLRQSLIEGFADFVMEMALDGTARAGAGRSAYGLAHEAALWREFKADVDAGRTKTEWLYRQKMSAPGRPADMGYWIGKRMCEAYHAKARDKRAAMRTLLELRDPQAILAESGYGL